MEATRERWPTCTEQRAAGLEEWDPLANKSILVSAQNGFMCISYSGLAYINGTPTDQWLAETASDRDGRPRRPPAGPALNLGPHPYQAYPRDAFKQQER
jgi:hypothetical protein